MAIFRTVKTGNYTMIDNRIIRSTEISGRAKNIYAICMSNKDDWNYNLESLAACCMEGLDYVRAAVRDLEKLGYIVRRRTRNAKGQLGEMEYIIYEFPELAQDSSCAEKPTSAKPTLDLPDMEQKSHQNCPDEDKPTLEKPTQENPKQAAPILENPMPNKTKYKKTIYEEENNKKTISPSTEQSEAENIPPPEPDWEKRVKESIDYEELYTDSSVNTALLDEIVSLMVQTLRSQKAVCFVCGKMCPMERVRQQLCSLRKEHILYSLSSVEKYIDQVKDRGYFLLCTICKAPKWMEGE